jgi:hypothetical protein
MPLAGPGKSRNRTVNRTVHRMMSNGGIGAISRALEHEREVGLSVRGELRFVVMEADSYQRLRNASWKLLCRKPAPTSPPAALYTNRLTNISSVWMPWL